MLSLKVSREKRESNMFDMYSWSWEGMKSFRIVRRKKKVATKEVALAISMADCKRVRIQKLRAQ